MSDAELKQWHRQFQAPDQEELRGGHIPPVPSEYATWWQWAGERWPLDGDPGVEFVEKMTTSLDEFAPQG